MKKPINAMELRQSLECACGCGTVTSDYYLHYLGQRKVVLAKDCFERELMRETRADTMPTSKNGTHD